MAKGVVAGDVPLWMRVLRAARTLESKGRSPFSHEELIVTAWKENTEHFGLVGYKNDYPDSNKVCSSIVGKKGMLQKGLLRKVGEKMYQISKHGAECLQAIDSIDKTKVKYLLNKDQRWCLLRMLESPAYEMYVRSAKQDLKFAQACRFWGISELVKGKVAKEKLDEVKGHFNQIEQLMEESPVVRVGLDRELRQEDLRALKNIHEAMMAQFERQLRILIGRL